MTRFTLSLTRFGVSWQTKTERKRRGTKFVVPDVSFCKCPWFRDGLELFELEFPLVERDYWIPELDSKTAWRSSPPEYARSLAWLHHLVFVAGKEDNVDMSVLNPVTDLTSHSARATMLDQAVHFDRSAQEIGVQANWKNPGPLVLKYTRSRSSLPAKMIKELVQEISREFTPECANEDDEIDDHEDRGVTLAEFFVKEIACKRAITPEFVHIGSVLPDPKCCRVPWLRARAAESVCSSAIAVIKMVDRTVYPNKDKVPELALRQIFGRQKLPEALCLLMADKGMLLVERMAMLGDSIASVKATLKAIVGDDNQFGPDAPAQELSLTLLTAVWKSCSVLQEHFSARRARMEEDPSKIPEIPGEDHAEFREIFVNHHPDVILTYMRVAEMRTRADRIVQTSGFSKTSDDLLRVVQSDNKVSIASDSDVMDCLHAFFIALEYLNICDFTIEAGPLKYLSELEEWRHDNRGLAVLLAAEVLTHHKQLWNDARSTAELEKFRQAEHEVSTPAKRPRSTSPTTAPTPPKNEARSRKNKARREKNKALLKKLSDDLKDKEKPTKPSVKLTEKVERDQRVPEKEWKKIMSFSYTGARRCPLYNCSLGWIATKAANDAPVQEPTAAELCSPPPWASWSQVPRDPDLVKGLGPWCLEIFSGTAGISAQWQQQGLLVLPPIDVTCSGVVLEPVDILDASIFEFVKLLCRMGAIVFLHLGTPCSSFSLDHQWQVTLANELLFRSLELFAAVVQSGGDASIENPRSSLLWQVPQVQQLKIQLHLYNVDVDQCQFGSAFRKPTRFLVSDARFLTLARSCDGSHQHSPLKGRLRLPWGEVVFMTKIAQEYPNALCVLFSEITHAVVFGIFPQFEASFKLVAPMSDRKRQLGDAVAWQGHRQEQAAQLACSSGYQLKRGAAKPLLDVECEPGVAIKWTLQVPHPFTVQPSLPDSILQNIKTIVAEPDLLQQRRHARLDFWRQRAHALLPTTDQELRAIQDPCLRRLLRGVPDHVDLQLGSCAHVKLYDELFAAVGSVDPLLLQGIRDGFPIVGNIQRSGPYGKRKATMEDVFEGSTVGPFGSEDEVSEFLGCSDWIPTQRFEVVQKNKVRGCDSATSNLINKTAVITEKLQLVSTDLNVAVLRELRTRGGDRALAGWVLDERKAYQILRMGCRSTSYLVMIGHSFGLVAAVYNYNRRSAFINYVLIKIFEMVAFNFYDD
ncbi:unnamed protein product, partial [Symbiodinium sp. CCMP2456]